MQALGPVAHLVSPNKIHHLFLPDWHADWPDAKLWGPKSTLRKRNDLTFEAALENTPPEAWQGVFEQALFRGSPLFEEVAFVHRPSGTVIFADLSENFSDDFLCHHWKPWQRSIAKVWGIVVGKGYAPLELRLSWLDRAPARKALERILETRPQRVIMAHGDWIRSGGEAYLHRAFKWLLRP